VSLNFQTQGKREKKKIEGKNPQNNQNMLLEQSLKTLTFCSKELSVQLNEILKCSILIFSSSQLFTEMTEQNFSTKQNSTFFLFSLSAYDVLEDFHSSLAQDNFPTSPNVQFNHTHECILFTPLNAGPATHSCPVCLVDKFVQNLNCSSL